MGQYYNIVNITKKEVIIPHDYDNNGLKLMEFSWEGNSVVKALEHKLATDWKGDEVYVCGDYADENYYEISDEEYERIILNTDELPTYRYLVNNEKHIYIDLENIPISDTYGDIEYKVAPLSLLLALGNGRGGGDYWETNNGYEYVGSWCETTKSVTVQNEEPPKNYTEFKPDFVEK